MTHARFWFSAALLVGSAGCPDGREPNVDEGGRPGLAQPLPEAQSMRSYSGMAARQRLVVRDATAWATTWQQIAGTVRPVPAVPAIDFASKVVIVAAMGTKNSGGYSIDIDDARIVAGDARISVTERSPGDGCVVTAALTAPVAVVVVPRFPGEARFLERTSQHACR